MQALSQEVAHYLGMNLSGIKIKRFADGEIYVQILVSGCILCSGAPAMLQPGCFLTFCTVAHRNPSVAAMCSSYSPPARQSTTLSWS